MAIAHPTHVVTIGIWEPQSARALHYQCWIQAGPFDGPEDVGAPLLAFLGATVERLELLERKEEQHVVATPPWEQLSIF